MKDLLQVSDLTAADLVNLLDLSDEIKSRPYEYRSLLANEAVFAYFTKPSTRTRVSLAEAVARLGGQTQFFGPADLQLGRGETIEDTAAVVSRYTRLVVIRTFSHQEVARFAAAATVPVVNALTDLHHPCQALADMMTIRARLGGPAGLRVVYVGAGNNVAHSLMEAGALLGCEVVVSTPITLRPNPSLTEGAASLAAAHGGSVSVVEDPVAAVTGADVVYTDVWLSMGEDETTRADRIRLLTPYQVNADLMAAAKPGALFMHCLPAHRGEEVTDEVMDGPRSVVLDQAENRLHTEQALIVALIEKRLAGRT